MFDFEGFTISAVVLLPFLLLMYPVKSEPPELLLLPAAKLEPRSFLLAMLA
jgi:hypothetical protein